MGTPAFFLSKIAKDLTACSKSIAALLGTRIIFNGAAAAEIDGVGKIQEAQETGAEDGYTSDASTLTGGCAPCSPEVDTATRAVAAHCQQTWSNSGDERDDRGDKQHDITEEQSNAHVSELDEMLKRCAISSGDAKAKVADAKEAVRVNETEEVEEADEAEAEVDLKEHDDDDDIMDLQLDDSEGKEDSTNFRRVTPRERPPPVYRIAGAAASLPICEEAFSRPSGTLLLDGIDVQFSSVQLLRELGRGEYGRVYECSVNLGGGGEGRDGGGGGGEIHLAVKLVDGAADTEAGADAEAELWLMEALRATPDFNLVARGGGVTSDAQVNCTATCCSPLLWCYHTKHFLLKSAFRIPSPHL
eukprot:SAG11_NODE_798_length_7127_cov_8.227803_3_plen_359_part_00